MNEDSKKEQETTDQPTSEVEDTNAVETEEGVGLFFSE